MSNKDSSKNIHVERQAPPVACEHQNTLGLMLGHVRCDDCITQDGASGAARNGGGTFGFLESIRGSQIRPQALQVQSAPEGPRETEGKEGETARELTPKKCGDWAQSDCDLATDQHTMSVYIYIYIHNMYTR